MKKLYVVSLSGVYVIAPSIKPYKNSKVFGKNKICEEAIGEAKVFGEAKVLGDSHVYKNAETCGKCRITDFKK